MNDSSPRTFTVRILRQDLPGKQGYWNEFRVEYEPDMNVISALQKIAESPVTTNSQDVAPVVWDCNCLEEVCGACTMVINGRVRQACTALIDNLLKDNAHSIELRPMTKFPVVRDLMVDREAFDRIIAAGGYVDVRTGSAIDANCIPIAKSDSDTSFDAAACIGCGACVASCKNASAMLFVAAKVSHLGHLPQGQPERDKRVLAMVRQMDAEGFGNCTNQYECEAACPKEISVDHIARLNRDYAMAVLREQLV